MDEVVKTEEEIVEMPAEVTETETVEEVVVETPAAE
jgi:hypothetical protein